MMNDVLIKTYCHEEKLENINLRAEYINKYTFRLKTEQFYKNIKRSIKKRVYICKEIYQNILTLAS
ncbi:hypothetical protein BpHYR1_016219 [Brachionus plicatilis]|uniref:Uncharacterized protein n=1 Tax=Brachionus plicatilis TaxID=10195 RepID=A0A3M7QTZ0_BRAPC|nr:hypothetical protein BpHYR1_016219 [Brachionus plicatilis]